MVEPNLFDVEGEPPVKKIREVLGLTQLQFAQLLGVYPHTISRWENGKGNALLSIGQIKALLAALEPYGITLKDLPDDLSRPAGQS
ncbi:helix-turn-helix domain-containing protein [Phormidium sp. FACHB-322]|uniref:helix-turn-helix transcriptional regulator n=1 Tax=unclassified Leptolyngbya TaxID=2650499 RepID=UPI001688F9B6|nr:helix-turn-helix domain-containing protein [Leptolyngbya sp. FACHB-60]MBD2030710.1 helix-turn-helix domain-containing protein [Phormidium sp. FACHB-322]